MEQNDFQELIDNCLTMAERLLTSQEGEFYPFGAQIKEDGELVYCSWQDVDNDFPSSQTKIDNLKGQFIQEMNEGLIRAYAIAFDALTRENEDSEKTDAVAIECFSKDTQQKIVYYFPYKINGDALQFSQGWGVEKKY